MSLINKINNRNYNLHSVKSSGHVYLMSTDPTTPVVSPDEPIDEPIDIDDLDTPL